MGGGFIVGTAEAVYNPSMGLTWAVMPITATMCFIIGETYSSGLEVGKKIWPLVVQSESPEEKRGRD